MWKVDEYSIRIDLLFSRLENKVTSPDLSTNLSASRLQWKRNGRLTHVIHLVCGCHTIFIIDTSHVKLKTPLSPAFGCSAMIQVASADFKVAQLYRIGHLYSRPQRESRALLLSWSPIRVDETDVGTPSDGNG